MKDYKVDEFDLPIPYYLRVGPIRSSAKVDEALTSPSSQQRERIDEKETIKELKKLVEIDLTKMTNYLDVKAYDRTKDGILKLRGQKERDINEPNKLKIDERLWSIGTQDKTS